MSAEKGGLQVALQPLQMMATVDPKAVSAQVQAIQQIMKDCMKEGTHYGKIPGCGEQNSLYKAGSETLLSAFKISVDPEVTEIRDGDHVTYKVRCIGRHMQSGIIIGVGVGEASTAEDKYAWRKVVCQEEFDETPPDRKRKKWSKGSGGTSYSVLQVRTNIADVCNTVLKMGKKRGQVDLCLTGLACSDIFTQDLEDLPEGMLEGDGEGQKAAPKNKYKEKPKSGEAEAGAEQATEKQVNYIRARLNVHKKTETDLCLHMKVGNISEILKSQVNAAVEWANAEPANA